MRMEAHEGECTKEPRCFTLPLLSLALSFPQGVIHVDNKVWPRLIRLCWTPKPLVFIFFVLVLICILIGPVPHSFGLWRPSLESHNLRQVCVIFPKFWRPQKTPDQSDLLLAPLEHLVLL